MKRTVKELLYIFLGTALMAVALNSILDANGLVDGGFSGIAIIVKNLTGSVVEGGIPLWFTNIILNVPMFFLGIRIKGVKFLAKSIWGTFSLSFWLYLLPVFPLVQDDLVLAAIYGGLIQGAGIGLVFLGRGTTGGTDMVAALIQHYVKHLSVARIMQLIDALIVAAGAFVFGMPRAMYAIVAIFVVAKVTDGILEGMNFAKTAFIITDKVSEMAELLMEELDRGVTAIPVVGMYARKERTMLYCVVGKKQIVHLKELVKQIDEKAFMIVSDAHEVLGEGFQTD